MQHSIREITSAWDKLSPGQPIRFTFLDERFANMYADVHRMGSIFTSFAVLAIIIACLGLFALAAFMAEQRRQRNWYPQGIGGKRSEYYGNFYQAIL